MTEQDAIDARLLPPGDGSLIAHELRCMGHAQPELLLRHHKPPLALKLLDVPQRTAMLLKRRLQQQESIFWCHAAPGTATDTVDLLLGGTDECVAGLRRVTPDTPLLRPLVRALEQTLGLQESIPQRLLLGDTAWLLGQRTYVMGILNVTPDSFSDGGLYLQPEQAVKHAEEMLFEGADIIDVGGQSSRPGAIPVPSEVERKRVVPVVRDIVKRYGARVSVDTYRATVAEAALDAGAVLINDISALRFDPRMAPLVARRHAAVVLMHMQGTPQTMQQAPTYHHIIDDVYRFLSRRLQYARRHGIPRQRIVLDPGFGFGKTVRHNLELLRGLAHFRTLGQPLLVGTSRKSFLGRLLQRDVWDRLEGTLASAVYAVLRGATLVRVHDIRPMVQALRLIDALERPPTLSR